MYRLLEHGQHVGHGIGIFSMSQQRVDRFLSRRFYGPAELVEAVLPNERHGPPHAVAAKIDTLPNLLQGDPGQFQPEESPEKFNDRVPQGEAFVPGQPYQHKIVNIPDVVPHLQKALNEMVKGIQVDQREYLAQQIAYGDPERRFHVGEHHHDVHHAIVLDLSLNETP